MNNYLKNVFLIFILFLLLRQYLFSKWRLYLIGKHINSIWRNLIMGLKCLIQSREKQNVIINTTNSKSILKKTLFLHIKNQASVLSSCNRMLTLGIIIKLVPKRERKKERKRKKFERHAATSLPHLFTQFPFPLTHPRSSLSSCVSFLSFLM